MLIADRYELGATLGEGGMGSVLSAVDTKTGRTVAVKLMRRHLVSDITAVRRFEREMHAMMLIEHPNTVRLYDFGRTAEDELYLVMELVSGCTVDEEIGAVGAFAIERVIRIGQHVARALAAVHAHGIVHRDLKPQNIMLRDLHGEPDWVLVLDFGIATLHNASRVTEAGLVAGSPAYCSPEQARGEVPGPKSDLYMLGVVLYEMTTGRLPFDSGTAFGFLTAHVNHIPEPVENHRPDAPRWLCILIRDLLQKDPAKRPEDAAAVLRRLSEQGEPAPARARKQREAEAFAQTDMIRSVGSLAPATATTRPARRWRPLLLLALSFAAVIAAAVAIATSTMTGERTLAVAESGPGVADAVAAREQETIGAEAQAPRPGAIDAPAAAAVEPTKVQAPAAEPPKPTTLEAPPPQPAEVLAPASATVAITSQPRGAKVVVDGLEVGVTPWTLVSRIGAKHHIELRLAGRAPQARDITVTSEVASSAITFPPAQREGTRPAKATKPDAVHKAPPPVADTQQAPPRKVELTPEFMDGD